MRSSLLVNASGRLAACILVCALLSACTTTQHFAEPGLLTEASGLRVGDTVTCTLQDGSKRTFVVRALDAAALHGDGPDLAWSEVRELEFSRFSPTKTTFLVLGLAAGVAAATVPIGHDTIDLRDFASKYPFNK